MNHMNHKPYQKKNLKVPIDDVVNALIDAIAKCDNSEVSGVRLSLRTIQQLKKAEEAKNENRSHEN